MLTFFDVLLIWLDWKLSETHCNCRLIYRSINLRFLDYLWTCFFLQLYFLICAIFSKHAHRWVAWLFARSNDGWFYLIWGLDWSSWVVLLKGLFLELDWLWGHSWSSWLSTRPYNSMTILHNLVYLFVNKLKLWHLLNLLHRCRPLDHNWLLLYHFLPTLHLSQYHLILNYLVH